MLRVWQGFRGKEHSKAATITQEIGAWAEGEIGPDFPGIHWQIKPSTGSSLPWMFHGYLSPRNGTDRLSLFEIDSELVADKLKLLRPPFVAGLADGEGRGGIVCRSLRTAASPVAPGPAWRWFVAR